MENNKACKIVQDLLPSYIENVTNDESNQFIEKHLLNCENCMKSLNLMKEDRDTMDKKKEINFFKKYKNKLKLLKIVILIIILFFLLTTIRKTIIISNLSNLSQQYINATNYHKIMYAYEKDSYIKNEVYCMKDKKFIETTKIIDGNKQITKIYTDGKSVNIYTEDEKGKTAKLNQKMQLSVDTQNYLYTDNFVHLVSYSIPASIKSKDYCGKSCYYIANFDTPYSISKDGVYIDKETGLVVRAMTSIEAANGIAPAVDYVYEFGNVTEENFIEPDIEEYTVIEEL